MSEEDEFVDILNDSPAVSAKKQKVVASQDVPEQGEEQNKDDELVEEEEEEDEDAPVRKVRAKRGQKKDIAGPKRGKQPARTKKAKVARKAQDDEFEQEEEEEEEEEDEVEEAHAVAMDDGNDEDEDEDEGSKKGGPRKIFKSTATPNTSLKNEGIIERIRLVNFMNHANLDVKLGPKINFITGPNGAGKSAILVGLSLCLGASTSFAQRSNKLGGFVRTGTQKAIISVTLRNVGEDTFKHDLYGDSITVERTITLAGKTDYKFKDHREKVVTTDRQELVPLCDRFNIQINNPCIIMMQETSRDFLGHSTPKKKYELFERATQIKVIQDSLSELMGDIASIAATLERKRALFPSLQRQHEVAEKEHEQIMHLKKVKEDMVSIKCELVWAQVEEREATVKNIRDMISEKEEKLENNRQIQADFEAKLAGLIAEEARLAAELQSVGQSSDDVLTKLTELREKMQVEDLAFEKAQRALKAHPKKIAALDQRIEKLEVSLANEAKNALGGPDKEELKRIELLKEYREALSAAQTDFDKATFEVGELRAALSAAGDELAKYDSRERTLDKSDENLRTQIAYLSRPQSSQDPSFNWGAKLPDVVTLIQRNSSKFRKEPIGPLGRCIKLVQEFQTVRGSSLNVVRAVESILGKMLPVFWCDNFEDMHLLMRLVNDAKLPPVRCHVQKFQDDVYSEIANAAPRPSDSYVRVIDAFTCEPKSVLNIVVDQTGVEGSVIVGEEDFKDDRILDERGVRKMFAADSSFKSKIGREGSIRYQGGGRPGTLTMMWSLRSVGDNKNVLSDIKKQAEENANELKDVRKRKEEFVRKRRDADANVREKNEEMHRLEQKIRDLKQKIASKEAERAVVATNETADIETKLIGLRQNREDARAQFAQAQRELNEIDGRRKDIQSQIDEIEKEHENSLAKKTGIENLSANLRKKVSKMKTKVTGGRSRLASFAEFLEADRASLVQASALLASGLEQANLIFPTRVKVTKSVSELENIVKGMEKALERQQKDKGKTIEQIEKEFIQTRDKLKKVTTRLDWLHTMLKEFSVGLNKRNEKLDRIRKLVAETVASFFQHYLTQKGYDGSTKFVHDRENPSLEVHVNLNPSSSSQMSQDPLTLSGGESSFSTVALLLALWEVIDTPFRIMDEFDIFMDSHHRQKSILMLIEFARTCPNRQFIFLSPLDSAAIPKHQPDIRIKILDAPDRGKNARQQTIADFTN